jgi:hypothetical protein
MKTFNYEFDKITGYAHPALYPGEKSTEWKLPDDIRTDFGKLNTIIETKYTREFLKICAFYNKMFPSLKSSNWTRTFYNVPPFTSIDQERSDTGTGIAQNYLKQIVDQIASRLGTITYDAALLADVPTLEYIMYKDEVERLLRKHIRNEDLSQMSLEMFHDAAILGYSHVFIDPYTHRDVKASDFEIGIYESQFNRNVIRQMLYRDYAFPVTELVPYLANCDDDLVKQVTEDQGSKATCDFKMYFDCPEHKVYITLGGTTLAPLDYPFDEVQMITFCWDTGFTRVMSTSLFDLLYPVQRELNKIMAKLQQLIRMYKGAVPVFNSDVGLAMRSITNGTGEALYVDSPRPIDTLMTVINPTPLDQALGAEITARKTEMYELAGIQQMSFDMENMRSAAAVIALDQTRDTVFQSQMMGRANFVQKHFKMRVNYNAVINPEDYASEAVSWPEVNKLINDGLIELKPIHLNDPLGNKNNMPENKAPDFEQMQIARTVARIIKNEQTYEELGFIVNRELVKSILAATMVKMDALNVEIPDHMYMFLFAAFVDDVKNGLVTLIPAALQQNIEAAMQPDITPPADGLR